MGKCRKRAHNHDTDDAVPILGDDLSLPKDFQQSYNKTKKMEMGNKCQEDYQGQIRRIIEFLKKDSLESKKYFEIGTKPVSTKEKKDPTKHFSAKCKRDLIYNRMNKKYILLFLAQTQIKPDGTLKLHEDL